MHDLQVCCVNYFKNEHKNICSVLTRLTRKTIFLTRSLLDNFGLNRFLTINKNLKRPRILILGTGWGFVNLVLDLDIYSNEVQFISPSKSFYFTPLLTQLISDKIPKEICEIPITEFTYRGGKEVIRHIEGRAIDIDKENKEVIYFDLQKNKEERISYDYLVINVGNENSTLIPGVKENAIYMRNTNDSLKIREKVLSNIKEVIDKWDIMNEDEKIRKLSFVVAGGGPTGVEISGAIAELVNEFISQKEYKFISKFVSIKVIEMTNKILSSAGDKVPGYAKFILTSKAGVEVMLETKLLSVSEDKLLIRKIDGNEEEIPYGVFIWASGASPNILTKQICEKITQQSISRNAIIVNERLQVIGIPSTYAIGDCAYLVPTKLSEKYKEIYELALKSSTGPTLKYLMNNLSTKEFPQMLNLSNIKELPQKDVIIDEKDFKILLENLDSAYTPPPPTAQSAVQQAKYLADTLNNYPSDKDKQSCPAFQYNWKGLSCYIFNNYVAFYTPFGSMMGGYSTLLFWRILYTSILPTWKTKFLFIKTWFYHLFKKFGIN